MYRRLGFRCRALVRERIRNINCAVEQTFNFGAESTPVSIHHILLILGGIPEAIAFVTCSLEHFGELHFPLFSLRP